MVNEITKKMDYRCLYCVKSDGSPLTLLIRSQRHLFSSESSELNKDFKALNVLYFSGKSETEKSKT